LVAGTIFKILFNYYDLQLFKQLINVKKQYFGLQKFDQVI